MIASTVLHGHALLAWVLASLVLVPLPSLLLVCRYRREDQTPNPETSP